MIFLMVISFYTSRVVLQKLGVEDFGIYNLVGSVVAMFSSLRTIFSASTQRFLNYEMGKSNYEKLNSIFNNSIIVNLIISVVFLVVVEAVGLWFLLFEINIDESRLFAAHCVFQFSVITAVVGIITTTFDAEIIAHEKMNFYAYLSIVEGSLKLFIVFLLSCFDFDRLILYGFLLLLISLVVFTCDVTYCRIHFNECRLKVASDKSTLKEMTKFAGWNFLGTNAYVLSQSGLNMVLNIFGGPVVNAARGIAYQVNGALNQFINNVVVVVNPYCIKTYASGDKNKAFEAISLSSKLFFSIQCILNIPLLLFTKEVLSVWLVDVPEYSVIFLQLVLFYSLLRTLHPGLDILFKAQGDIKGYQICEGILLILPLVFIYLVLKAGQPYYTAFVVLIFFDFINLLAILFICSQKTGLSKKKYLIKVLAPCVVSSLILVVVWLTFIEYTIVMKLTIALIAEILVISYMFIIGLSPAERKKIIKVLKRS